MFYVTLEIETDDKAQTDIIARSELENVRWETADDEVN